MIHWAGEDHLYGSWVMRRILLAAVSALAFASCSRGAEERPAAAAESNPRKIDTAIANSGLPGAGAVGRAMGAADQASARARVQDSLAELK